MGASYGKFSELHIERVWSLSLAGYTGRKITRLLANGFPRESPPVAPLKVSEQAVNQLIRQMKSQWDELESIKMATVPTQANADALRARILRIANREAERLGALQSVGKLDADDLRKLAAATKSIEAMEELAAKRARRRSTGGNPPPTSPVADPPESVVGALLRKGATDDDDAEQTGIASGSAPVVP